MKSQNLLPLNSGTYAARSKIANYQIAENVFPEINPDETDPDVSVTHYPVEGEKLLSACPAPGPGRGVFTLSNGNLYAIVGQGIYSISPDWTWTQLGSTLTNASNPVSMSDNGTTAVIVDGSPNGYTINMANNAFGYVQDVTGLFVGSTRIDFSDTFFALSVPGTNEWYVSLSNQVAFNALALASKDTSPDPIQTLAFNLRQAWLIGTERSEVWTLTGGVPFPYTEWPNTFVNYGTAAPYSLVQADVSLFWISRNPNGEAIAVKTNGYGVEAISTRALEYEWSNYQTVADVIGGSFQLAGHTFVAFHFPTANVTWRFDLATKQWHKRTHITPNGVLNREKVAFYASVGAVANYPMTTVGQDWQNGSIYSLSNTVYTDNGVPIVCRRTFPHVLNGMKFITHPVFVADFETGGVVGTQEPQDVYNWAKDFNSDFAQTVLAATLNGPALCMRYSNDGGATFGNYRQKGLVTQGHYRAMMRWRGLGMARDRVYELLWAYNGPSALQGAYIDPMAHGA